LLEILNQFNVTISEAENGDEAYDLVQNREFDLILMDIEMPGQSGLEVTQKIRQILSYEHTPIIIMTALQNPKLIQEAFEVGATDYISKPLTEYEVISRIRIRMDKRQLERELIDAKNAAEQANYAKSEFISRLAHELKTPLNAISGFTQLIQLETDNKSCLENCSFIMEAANYQEDLINEVTNLAKIEAGVIDIDLSNVDLVQIIKESFSLTQPIANKFNIRLNFPRRSDVMYTLKADHKRLKQVFLNLLSNAIKYNKPNGEVNLHAKTLSNGRIKIGVSDTGYGISKEDIPKLFETFNRLGAEKTDIEGTGIGLPISRKIVELMGGELSVESTKGEGSIFWIELKGNQLV